MYASLIVQVEALGIRQPLTYRVPDELSDLKPGDCVVVPFGKQEALGFVVALDVPAPTEISEEQIKPIWGGVAGEGAFPKTRIFPGTCVSCRASQRRRKIPRGDMLHTVR